MQHRSAVSPRFTVLLLAFLVVAAACSDPTHPPRSASIRPDIVSNGRVPVIVTFRDSVRESDLTELRATVGEDPKYQFRGLPAVMLLLPRAKVAALSGQDNPRVVRIETGAPMPRLSETVGYHFSSVPAGHGFQAVHNDGSSQARFGSGIGIAVLDDAIDCTALADFPVGCAGRYDFTDENSPNTWVDRHGTEVASTILADRNTIGIAGVAPAASIYSMKIYSFAFPDGDCAFNASAIDYATYSLPAVSIINASYGRQANTTTQRNYYDVNCASERGAVSNAVNAGILFVAAAGNVSNGNDSVASPARLPGVLAVGGLTLTNRLAWWSGSAQGPTIGLAAAATDVPVLDPVTGAVWYVGGTSFAAPLVVGAAALVQAKNNKPRYGQCTKAHLRATAYAGPGLTDTTKVGKGALDAWNAWNTPMPCSGPGGPPI